MFYSLQPLRKCTTPTYNKEPLKESSSKAAPKAAVPKRIRPQLASSTKSLKLRVDLVLRLLLPTVPFRCLDKSSSRSLLKQETILVWPKESLDQLALLLYCNPMFLGTKLYDISAFIPKEASSTAKTVYYVFSLPLFSSWVTVFLNSGSRSGSTKGILSIETLFKSAA